MSGVSRREQLAFAAGDTGFNFVWQTIELYLLFYYVRILGLAPEAAAGIFLAGAAVDLIADPLIGTLVDRFESRVPVRAWLLFAGPPLGLALALAFVPPPADGGAGLLFLTATHLVLRTTYSLGNIPYAALTARITDDPAQQIRLTSMRMQGAALGGLLAALAYFAFPLARQWHGIPIGAIVLGFAAQPLFIATWRGVRERVRPFATKPGTEPARQFSFIGILQNSSVLRRLMVLILFTGISTTVLHKGLLFAFDALDARNWGYAAAMVPALALFAGAYLWTRLAERRGRVAVLRLAALVHAVAILAAWAWDSQLAAVAVLLSLAIFASAGMSTMFWALVPGVIESCERTMGSQGYAARIFGLANLSRKLGQALAPQVIALSLAVDNSSVLPAMALAAGLAVIAAWLAAPRDGELRRARL